MCSVLKATFRVDWYVSAAEFYLAAQDTVSATSFVNLCLRELSDREVQAAPLIVLRFKV